MLLGVTLIGLILYSRQKHASDLSFDSIYLAGNNFGYVHRILQTQMPSLRLFLITELSFSALKIGFLHDIRYDVIITHLWLVIYTIILRLKDEKFQRNAFEEQVKFRESLRKFKELLDVQLPENIVILDKNLKKALFWNHAFQDVFEVNDEEHVIEILGKIKCGIDFDSESSFSRTLSQSTLQEESSLLGELKRMSPQDLHLNCQYTVEGTKKLYVVDSFPLLWDKQEAITLILQDITSQKELISLKVADVNKDKALSTVSHELRTPIGIILSMIKMAEMQNMDKLLQGTLNIIKSNATFLLNIVNSILDLKQMKAGKIVLNKENINLKETLMSLKPMFEVQCQQKNIELKVDVDVLPETFYTDKNRLAQIIMNLVANALKFTFQGSITIGGEIDTQDKSKVWFWVKDTGIGIKETDKDKLFKMFGKLEDSSKINTHGVGLGLTISNSLVKILNNNDEDSYIRVESEYGKGTKFYFYLVIEECNQQDAVELTAIPEEPKAEANIVPSSVFDVILPSKYSPTSVDDKFTFPSSPRLPLIKKKNSKKNTSDQKVLLVDDNTFNLIFPKLILEQEGFQVLTAYNGKEALEMIERESQYIRFILMDCQMPIMDGFKATAILKEKMRKNDLPSIPIYALSANDSEYDRERCMQVGMDGYLMKPLNEVQLKEIIQKCKTRYFVQNCK